MNTSNRLKTFRNKLQTRLTALTLLISIPLLAAVVIFVIERAGSQMNKDANEHLRMTNRVLSVNTSTWVNLNVRALQEMVTLPEITSMTLERQKPFLEKMHEAYPYMYLVSTTDLNGMNIARNDEEAPTDYSDRVWFQGAREGAVLTFQSLIGRTSGQPALVVSMPIKDETGDIVGVGMFAADLEDISKETLASRVGDTGFAYIVDIDNRTIAHPDSAYTSELRDLSHYPPVAALRSGKHGNMTFTDQDGLKWRAHLDVLDNGWGIIVQQREDEVLNSLHLFQRISFLTLGIGSLAILILSWLLIGRGLRPIKTLTHAAADIAAGDLSRTVTVKTQDEVGILAEAFNSMTVQLRELIGGLEDRVNARTRDLQVAADVSRQITTELDVNELLKQVTTLTVQSFNLYGAFVFLMAEEGKVLSQIAGADSKGRSFENKVISDIPIDAEPSLIALAARSRQVTMVNDVTQSKAYLPVKGLPNVQSELVIPMVVGDQLLGVFDLQSDLAGRFAEEDQKVLTALAEQITIAIRNAQLFHDMKTAQQQAEQANTVKSRFLAAMSHELRTPLNAILNFTQFVVSGVMGPVNQRQQDALQKVTTSGEHLLDLINDVLDITKIEVGSLQLFVENDVHITEYLEMAVSTAKSMLADKPVNLNVDISDDLPVIQGDKLRIRQILLNLVSNACKFTDTGSVSIRAYQQDDSILFSVKDTGPGIAPEEQYHIFEAFQQTQLGLKKGGGTGLGLAISRRLAEAHGGTLWFESTLGQGTTFFLALPISEQIPVTGA